MYDTDDPVLVLRLVVGALALLALLAGLARRARQNTLRRSWCQVPGEVIGEHDLRGASEFRPVIRYQTYPGDSLVANRSGGWNVVTPVTGQTVPVWYDPAKPSRSQAQVHGIERHGTVSFIAAIALAVLFALLWL